MNVGEYVRTKDGLIRKIKEIGKLIYIDKEFVSEEPEYHNSLLEEDIKKSSPQIIDLIEKNDFVNGYKVIGIVKGFKILVDKLELDTTTGLYHHKSIMAKDIKTIVTHEQMETMQYRVEE